MANTALFGNKKGKEKKELTPQQQKAKKIINWVITAICILLIVFALFIAIMTITRTAGDRGVANIFGTAFMPVQSDSMSGTFEKDDLILTKIYKGDGSDLKVGQVVTFKSTTYSGGAQVTYYNTHRIVNVQKSNAGDVISVRTKGDNEADIDKNVVPLSNIVATWGSVKDDGTAVDGKNWGQVGKAINWLQSDRTNYFLVIVLPLILLFVIYAFILVRTLIINKMSKSQASAEDVVNSMSDEEKRRLVTEYLATLQAGNTNAPAGGDAPAPIEGAAEGVGTAENAEGAVNEDKTDVSDVSGNPEKES